MLLTTVLDSQQAANSATDDYMQLRTYTSPYLLLVSCFGVLLGDVAQFTFISCNDKKNILITLSNCKPTMKEKDSI